MTESSGPIGSVASLWRFPVKSMRGERLERARLTPTGVRGDRAFALIDVETGKVVSAKSIKRFPDLLRCRASFVEPPAADGELPPVRIELPDGATVDSDAGDVDRVLSGAFGREVTLARSAPADYTVDQYHPDVERVDPFGHRDTFVDQKLGSALFEMLGIDSPVPVGSFMDAFPLSVITTSTLDRLAELRPESRIDERRFRMNLTLRTESPGFVEHGWLGRPLAIGDAVRIRPAMDDPRCVMTTLAVDDLPDDTEILRTMVRHNRREIPGAGSYPCAGVYAVVDEGGVIDVGDRVVAA